MYYMLHQRIQKLHGDQLTGELLQHKFICLAQFNAGYCIENIQRTRELITVYRSDVLVLWVPRVHCNSVDSLSATAQLLGLHTADLNAVTSLPVTIAEQLRLFPVVFPATLTDQAMRVLTYSIGQDAWVESLLPPGRDLPHNALYAVRLLKT